MPSSTPVWVRRGLAGDGAGQPEVGDLDGAVLAQDDVLGLDVAVDDAGRVGRAERLQDGPRMSRAARGRERALGLASRRAGSGPGRTPSPGTSGRRPRPGRRPATTLGWDSRAAERASRLNRLTKASSWARSGRITLSATSRSSRCRARGRPTPSRRRRCRDEDAVAPVEHTPDERVGDGGGHPQSLGPAGAVGSGRRARVPCSAAASGRVVHGIRLTSACAAP